MDLFLFVRVLGLGICLLLLYFFFVVWVVGEEEKSRKKKKTQTRVKTGGTMCPSVSLSCVSFFARVCCVCVDFRQPQHRL